MNARILIVEDDLDLGTALVQALRTHAIDAVWVRRAREGLQHLDAAVPPDVLLLDLQLPDGDGLSLLDHARHGGAAVGVIVISARDALASRTDALDRGADDYLVKPFPIEELVSRIGAVLRRVKGRASALWRVGAFTIDTRARTVVHADGRAIELARREFDLLVELAGNAGRVLTREHLEARLYREPDALRSNALDVHVHGLRKKLGEGLIRTVRGVGFLIDGGPPS